MRKEGEGDEIGPELAEVQFWHFLLTAGKRQKRI